VTNTHRSCRYTDAVEETRCHTVDDRLSLSRYAVPHTTEIPNSIGLVPTIGIMTVVVIMMMTVLLISNYA